MKYYNEQPINMLCFMFHLDIHLDTLKKRSKFKQYVDCLMYVMKWMSELSD